jgi:DnaJ-domain-containing protein 1
MHPDFFAGAPAAARALAERNTAELNSAFELLSDDFRRADWLVKSLGGPDENEQRDMPREFLVEVMEWNEVLEEARASASGSNAHAAALALCERLLADRRDLLARIGALLEPLPERGSLRLVDARRTLNAVRYVDRALEQIEELRLQRAPSTRS